MKLLDPVGRRRQADSCHRLLQTDKKSRGSGVAHSRRAGQEQLAGSGHSEAHRASQRSVWVRLLASLVGGNACILRRADPKQRNEQQN